MTVCHELLHAVPSEMLFLLVNERQGLVQSELDVEVQPDVDENARRVRAGEAQQVQHVATTPPLQAAHMTAFMYSSEPMLTMVLSVESFDS